MREVMKFKDHLWQSKTLGQQTQPALQMLSVLNDTAIILTYLCFYEKRDKTWQMKSHIVT